MKQTISILITLAITLQSFSSFVIMAGYEMNKDYISQNLCINRNKPAMHCNGQCHLNKQLQEQNKKDQSPSSPVKGKQQSTQFFQDNTEFIFSTGTAISQATFLYLSGVTQPFTTSVFHPPSC